MLNDIKDDIYFMRAAIAEANKAANLDEVPIGCVIVDENRIIAKAHNQVETLTDSTAHAEMIALTQAQDYKKMKWLNDCTVYVTIEPCLMCANAFVLSRVKRVVFGACEPKTGALGSLIDVTQLDVNHKFEVESKVLENECVFLIQDFFRKKRIEKKNK